MGGGNAQKSATARARNEAKKAKAGKGSQLAVNQAAQNVICQVSNIINLASGLAVIIVPGTYFCVPGTWYALRADRHWAGTSTYVVQVSNFEFCEYYLEGKKEEHCSERSCCGTTPSLVAFLKVELARSSAELGQQVITAVPINLSVCHSSTSITIYHTILCDEM